MSELDSLSDAQVVLLASHLATDSAFTKLEQVVVARRKILTDHLLYQLLLTFLPVDPENQSPLTVFLTHLIQNFDNVSPIEISIEPNLITHVLQPPVMQKLTHMRLSKLQSYEETEPLTNFIIAWVHLLEGTAGLSNEVAPFVELFTAERPYLARWCHAHLLPLLRLQNDFYPGRADELNLEMLENLSGADAAKTLLQFAAQEGESAQVGRDLQHVVAPWIHGSSTYHNRTGSQGEDHGRAAWQGVNAWILDQGYHCFPLAAKAALEWDGPLPTHQQGSAADHFNEYTKPFARMMLALVLSSDVERSGENDFLHQLLDRASSLLSMTENETPSQNPQNLRQVPRADLAQDRLLRADNSLTQLADDRIEFLKSCLVSQQILGKIGIVRSVAATVDVTLFGPHDKQLSEFRHLLQMVTVHTGQVIDWKTVRAQVHELHTSHHRPSLPAFLSMVEASSLEADLLAAILRHGHFTAVKQIYLPPDSSPLPKATVEQSIVTIIYEAYDNASNGNRTRGGMKQASDLVTTFRADFPDSTVLTEVEHLIRATHSLSFYHLVLQHGVPFRPATIRVHHDPVELIGKALEQDPKAYTKLDDLVGIGRNFVLARLPNSSDTFWSEKSVSERLFDVEHRVIYLAISSALSQHDFDTAYSYVTSRLSTRSVTGDDGPYLDDTSWRAAYATGKYRPDPVSKNLHERIKLLSKQIDLLAHALVLAPDPKLLPEILAAWRRLEDEMDSLRAHALEEERRFEPETSRKNVLPGDFGPGAKELDAAETRRLLERRAGGTSGPTYEEEAPMGLFDVARGAASAFRKSAFPLSAPAHGGGALHANASVASHVRQQPKTEPTQGELDVHNRVRKRDLVSNMVTGGLVSGLSWALGAQRVPDEDSRSHER